MAPDPPTPATAIATSSADRIVVRGRDLVQDLLGKVDFTTMICFHLRGGQLPTPGEVAVVDSVLVALMEHGLTPSSMTARLIYGSSPEAVQGAVAAGLLGAGSQFLGSTEDAARILQEGAAAIAAGDADVAGYAAETVRRQLASGTSLPGFGHHIHRPDDPRAPRLLEIAREHDVAGVHAELLMALSAALDAAKGRHVTINATGAVAAVLSDVGYPWHVMRGFSLIARAAGLVGHVLEESERPIGRQLWAMAEREIPYDGPLPGMIQAPDTSLTLGLLRGLLEGRNGDADVVSAQADGPPLRTTLAATARRAGRLAGALAAQGVARGDRVATLAWNVREQLEAYWAVPCMGAVLHTLNPRLLPEQIASAVTQAGDRVVLVQADLVPLAAQVLELVDCVERVIVFGGAASLPGALDYERLLAAQDEPFAWPQLSEHDPAGLCFTSGTTGEPKGVVYSHRMLVLHALTMAAFDPYALPARDRVLAVVPMFHAMGWNLPYVAALTGASLVLPNRFLASARLARLIADERVTFSCGVPTVWADLLQHVETTATRLDSLRTIACGGSRVPLDLMQRWDARGVTMLQGWGMTETGPGAARVSDDPALDDDRWAYRERTGRMRPLYEARIRGDDGTLLPHDGVASGELEVRGPMVVRGYLGDPADGEERFRDGWLRTGDIGSLDARGWLRLVDREKDVIKSGGEWISSLDLESALATHPGVAQAAVIGVADERWMERPLACVVRTPAVARPTVTAEQLRRHLDGRVPSWWIPERIAFVDELPTTGVGKLDKRSLRARHSAGTLDVEEQVDG